MRESTADLARIRAYIAHDSESAAEDVRLRIIAAVKQVQEFPHLGRVGRRRDTRQVLVAGLPYIIVYRLGEGELVLLAIFRGAQEH